VAAFQEAWADLLGTGLDPEEPDGWLRLLNQRTWVVLPKEDGANRTARLRDIELCNETRKVLARIATTLLDEVCDTSLSRFQQAFVSKRDIVNNNIRLHTAFQDAAHKAELLLLLCLDCSKGYNHASWQWTERVLRQARLPRELRSAIMAFMHSEAFLLLGGKERGSVRFSSGYPQGCPLSCFLYIIIVDPLLTALSKEASVVSGFVDDWSAGLSSPAALDRALALVDDFALASGQVINRAKSALLPSRELTPPELAACTARWPDLRISARERVLGLILGTAATIEDQYEAALGKLARKVELFTAHRDSFSFATKILVVNVFLFSLFGYVNRHFYMPDKVLQQAEALIRPFLSRLPFSKLRFFSHVSDLYGTAIALRDLRLSNVSLLLHTYHTHEEVAGLVADSLALRSAPARRLDRRSLPSCTKALCHPADSWLAAFGFFLATTGRSVSAVTSVELLPGADSSRMLYRELLRAERPQWVAYLEAKVRAQGWVAPDFVARLRSLPRSTPQGHRWHLLKLHLGGHPTTSYLTQCRVMAQPAACPFCGTDQGDSTAHLLNCPAVQEAVDAIQAEGRVQGVGWHLGALFLGRPLLGDVFCALLSLLTATWEARGMHFRGYPMDRVPRLASFIGSIVECPWLVACMPDRDRKERRRSRARAPPSASPGTLVYRSDGASRGQGQGGRGTGDAGWGAACWEADSEGRVAGPPSATSRGPLGRASNNVAEYQGILACLRRAVHHARLGSPLRRVLFQVDSAIVAGHLRRFGSMACTAPDLLPLYSEALHLCTELSKAGVEWDVAHIYREFNCTADALANEGVDLGAGSVGW